MKFSTPNPNPHPTHRRGEAFGQTIQKLPESENPNAAPNPDDNPPHTNCHATSPVGEGGRSEALRFQIYRQPKNRSLQCFAPTNPKPPTPNDE